MDRRFLEAYEAELKHLRELGGAFAQEFPKIAGRLGLSALECADPHVERLLEGFAFMAARVQRKLDAEFPQFTSSLLETVYPQYLAPTPSMVLASFAPDLAEGDLAKGFPIPRGAVLKSQLGKGDQTPCEFRTAHALELFPLEISEARYHGRQELPALAIETKDVAAALRIQLTATAGVPFDKIALSRLPLFLQGAGSWRLHEALLASTRPAVVRVPGQRKAIDLAAGKNIRVHPKGFAADEALLPPSPRSFDGYRLLKEYFYFPTRFSFVELQGLERAVPLSQGTQLEIIIPLERFEESLTTSVSAASLLLFCTPAINLFPKRCDRIHVSTRHHEFHVVPDRNRPLDFEVFDVLSVSGFAGGAAPEREFQPFYRLNDASMDTEGEAAYFTTRRAPRLLSATARETGRRRSSYLGTETFVSLVDGAARPFPPDLRQLGIDALCTNRDLAIHMPRDTGRTDFQLEIAAPVKSIRTLQAPVAPKMPHAADSTAWRIVSHLSLNYLSLVDKPDEGASGLRALLRLYADRSEAFVKRQIEGVKALTARPILRRVHKAGPIAFARGLELTLSVDESHFEGASAFLLGSVLEEFFRRHVGLNSFTETVLRSPERDEIMRWPARLGTRYPI